jgi:hypothetical protein
MESYEIRNKTVTRKSEWKETVGRSGHRREDETNPLKKKGKNVYHLL